MTTSKTPIGILKSQATAIAAKLKAASRGETIANDPGGRIAAALARDSFTFGVVMDDKVIKIKMPWELIRTTSEPALVEWILGQMQGATRQ